MTNYFCNSSTMRRLLIGIVAAFLMQNMAWSAMNVTSQSEDGTWIVICTSQGFKRILVDDFYNEEGTNNNLSANSCELCVFANGLGFSFSNTISLTPILGVIAKVSYDSYIQYGKKYYSNHTPRAPPINL